MQSHLPGILQITFSMNRAFSPLEPFTIDGNREMGSNSLLGCAQTKEIVAQQRESE